MKRLRKWLIGLLVMLPGVCFGQVNGTNTSTFTFTKNATNFWGDVVVAGLTGLTPGQVGLGNVENVSWNSTLKAQYDGYAANLSNDNLSDNTTTQLTEGTNLYYTTARARGDVNATDPITLTTGTFGFNSTLKSAYDGYATSKLNAARGNWKVFYSNDTGVFTELALGADGTYLKSNGAAAAPTFAAISVGGGNVSQSAAVTANNITSWGADNVVKDGGLTVASIALSSTVESNYFNKSVAISGNNITNLTWTKIDNAPNFGYGNGTSNLTTGDINNVINTSNSRLGALGYVFDGSNATVTTGSMNRKMVVPYNATIYGWQIWGNTTANATVEVWYNSTGNPVVGDKISASAPVKLTNEFKNVTGDVSTWTTTVVQNGTVTFNVTAADGNWTAVKLLLRRNP
jgi:hypothetical protein